MSLSKMFEELALKIGSEDNDIVKAIQNEPESDVAKVASHTLTQVIKFLFAAADQLSDLQKEDVIDTTGTDVSEPLDTEGLELIAALATECDKEGSPEMLKIASVLDEILLTIRAPKGSVNKIKQAEDNEIEKLRAKYREESLQHAYGDAKLQQDKDNKVEEAEKAIKDKVKTYRPNEHALSTRYSPDMPGVSLMRIGDNVFQCPVTKKVYNYESGFTTADGDRVPGGSVSNQTQQLGDRLLESSNFTSREQVLNQV